MDMLSVYMVKQANSCFTRLACSPSIAEALVETREMMSRCGTVVTTNTARDNRTHFISSMFVFDYK